VPLLPPIYATAARGALAAAAYLTRDVELARRLRQDTSWFVPQSLAGSDLADPALGVLAPVVGEREEAIRELRASRDRMRHNVLAHVWSTPELGRALAEGGRVAQREEARPLLDEALAVAQKYGLPPIEALVREAM
jgi:hypothetical protein